MHSAAIEPAHLFLAILRIEDCSACILLKQADFDPTHAKTFFDPLLSGDHPSRDKETHGTPEMGLLLHTQETEGLGLGR